MHLLGQRPLGILILLLLALLVAVKKIATGSALERPAGPPLLLVVNTFNLFFLLVINPVAAVLLIAGRADALDPARIAIGAVRLRTAAEVAGLFLYVAGVLLMAWALATLGASYQLGGLAPRPGDAMVARGPYRLVRHPMYAAALSLALGLACLLQSWAVGCVFVVYLGLIVVLIPREEEGLRRTYGDGYAAYARKVRRLLPLVY